MSAVSILPHKGMPPQALIQVQTLWELSQGGHPMAPAFKVLPILWQLTLAQGAVDRQGCPRPGQCQATSPEGSSVTSGTGSRDWCPWGEP